MYKIALVAGHFLGTAGKNIPKALDPNETKEWVLNNRICDKIEALLSGYTGYELLRIDDTTGKRNISLADRVRAANEWGADEWYEVHHNALNGTPWNGGGIEVYAHPSASSASREMQKQLYDALIAKTGLEGNRSQPLRTANFYTLRSTKMPAVLMELGFMDSVVDAPIILTEAYADKCAAAIVAVMVQRGGLKEKPMTGGKSIDEIAVEVIDGLWGNGQARKDKLTAAGYDPGVIQARVNEILESCYIVRAGDTLWSIAEKELGYGPRFTEIKELNGLTSDIIHTGQVLKLPEK